MSTYSIIKYFLMSKMSTWIHPTFCLVADFKTLMYTQGFGDLTITETDRIEKNKEKDL